MEKTISVNIPSEPYGEIDENAISVDITYTGARYIVFSLDSNKDFYAIEGSFDDTSEFTLTDFVHDGHTFHVLDADVHTFEACLLTSNYTHEPVDPWTETLATGEEIDYHYPNPGVLAAFWNFSMDYDLVNNTWTPHRITSPIEASDLFRGINNEIADIEAALADDSNSFNDDLKSDLNDWLTWAKAASTNYAGLPAWKIPYKPVPRY